MSRHITLLGLMGSGKSTIGARLAAYLGSPFNDTDTVVSAAHGSIATLFAEHGEATFRRYETEALRDLCARAPRVIATGGGIVTSPESRRLLATTLRIFLRVDLDELLERLRTSSTQRPLLGALPTRERIERLWHERHRWYEEAEVQIDGGGLLEAVFERLTTALAVRGLHRGGGAGGAP